jgi:NTE family protein
MKAYAVLDGGGVKGAALAGALQAAQEFGIEFIGYGGTSAGAIVAFLSSLGYTPKEIREIVIDEIDFTQLLDDGGVALRRLVNFPRLFKESRLKVNVLWQHRDLISLVVSSFGLYRGREFEKFLLGKIEKKLPQFAQRNDVTFDELRDAGCKPLKVVVSHLAQCRPIVFSSGGEFSGSAILAVRASMSYPFVFQPIRNSAFYQVDGGLSSNLPLFLFENERYPDNVPVVAFDLLPSLNAAPDTYTIREYVGDMISTALESGDYLMKQVLDNVYYVGIPVPAGIRTLNFDIDRSTRESLYDRGYTAATQEFHRLFPQWKQTRDRVETLQALHAPATLVTTILRAFAKTLEQQTAATTVRAHVMLPTRDATLLITYQYGMDQDPDVDLELPLDAGCSGKSWQSRRPAWADLDAARAMTPEKRLATWKIPLNKHAKVRADRKAAFSLPIFRLSRRQGSIPDVDLLQVMGVLSADTSTALTDSEWIGAKKDLVVETAKEWADILARLMM